MRQRHKVALLDKVAGWTLADQDVQLVRGQVPSWLCRVTPTCCPPNRVLLLADGWRFTQNASLYQGSLDEIYELLHDE